MHVRVGDCGQTTSSLHPQGFVRIHGKRYDARSEYDPLAAGTEVVVVGGDLQGLVVRKVEPGRPLERLPGYGKVVHSSFGELLAQQERLESSKRAEWQAGRPSWRAARRAYGLRKGAVLGALFAAVGLALTWEYVSQATELGWLLALAVAAAGVVWGVIVFRVLDETQQRLLEGMLPQMEGRSYDRLTLLTTGLGLFGTTAGAALVVPHWGLGAGLVVALVATAVLGLVVPGFLAINAPSDE